MAIQRNRTAGTDTTAETDNTVETDKAAELTKDSARNSAKEATTLAVTPPGPGKFNMQHHGCKHAPAAAATRITAAIMTPSTLPGFNTVITRHLVMLIWLLLLGMSFWQQAAAAIATPEPVTGEPHSTHTVPTAVTGIDVAAGDTFALDEAGTGMLYWQATQGYVNTPLLRSDIRVDVTGPVATTTFIQTFQHPDSGAEFADSHWLEGIYVFPLPEDAALRQLQIQVGERVIEGVIKERLEARDTYQQAASSGQIASIVEQQRPDLMQLRVANIAPGEAVTVTLSYLQSPAWEQQRYSLRIPMTLTPRYINQRVEDAAAITAVQLPAALAASHGQLPVADISVSVAAASDTVLVDSTSHSISQQQHGERTQVQVAGPVPMDRDFLLSWQPAAGATPLVQHWQQTTATERYLLAMIIPALNNGDSEQRRVTRQPASDSPSRQPGSTTVARELILVIDTSGSMGGDSIRAARLALDEALQGLTTEDFFNVIEFNTNANALFRNPVQATATNIRRARQYTARLQADGGTEMAAALELALASGHSERLRQVVFITDGSVGDESYLLRRITRQLGRSRLFTVGIGTAPNTFFMQRAARSGRGTYTYITQIADVYAAMDTLFAKLSQPALTDITAEWIGGRAELAVDPIPDIYLGEPLNLVAQIETSVTGVVLRGYRGSQAWQQTMQLPAPAGNTLTTARHTTTGTGDHSEVDSEVDHTVDQAVGNNPVDTSTVADNTAADHAIATLWARKKIADLRDRQRLSTQPDAFRQPITHLAMTHHLVSPYTSLVAIDRKSSRPANEPMLPGHVTQLMPAGSTGMTLLLPAGAAGTDTLLLLSLLSGTLAFALLWLRRYLLSSRPEVQAV